MKARLIILLLRGFSWLPLPVAHGIGWLLGLALFLLPNDLAATARTNLSLCFPEISPVQRRRLLFRTLVETGKLVTESGAIWLWPIDRLWRHVRNDSGLAPIQSAIAAGKAAIVACPHFGAWEMVGLALPRIASTTSLYRPPKLEELDSLVRPARQRSGANLVPTNTEGVRALLTCLKQGGIAGILPDQDPGQGNGVFAPFFGIPSNCMTLLPRLRARTQAPVFLVHAERLSWGRGYAFKCTPVSIMTESASLEEDAAILNREIEQLIRRRPEQYLWGYKRFKTRPPGAPTLYR